MCGIGYMKKEFHYAPIRHVLEICAAADDDQIFGVLCVELINQDRKWIKGKGGKREGKKNGGYIGLVAYID